jgi:hypothetical protein
MPQDLAVLAEDTHVHAASVQINATIRFMRFGVESHEGSSSSVGCFPGTNIPRRYVEEGASISIKGLEPTR